MRSRFCFVPVLAVLMVFWGGIVSPGKSQSISSRTYIISCVIDPRQIAYAVNLFRNRLHVEAPNAGIVWCNDVTRVVPEGGKDFALGAACTVQSGNNRFSALMCENSRLGKLVCAQSKAPTRDEVIQFIERDCVPEEKNGGAVER